jgi:hypothetical protein
MQAFIGVAFVLIQPHIAEALDRPLPINGERGAHIDAVRCALLRTVPLALLAVVVSGILTRPALSGFIGQLADPSDLVRGVFGAVWVFGVILAAALVNIAFGLRSRLGQLRSARW